MKNERTKNILLAVLLVAVVTLTIAYAALTATLTINSQAVVGGQSTNWKIKFVKKTGAASGDPICVAKSGTTAAVTTDATLTDTLISGLVATFKAPGDEVTCEFAVTNAGQIPAKLSTFTLGNTNLTYTGSGDNKSADETLVSGKIQYSVVWGTGDTSAGSQPATNDALAVGATRPLKLTMTYPANETSMPTNDVSVTGFSSVFNYIQAN